MPWANLFARVFRRRSRSSNHPTLVDKPPVAPWTVVGAQPTIVDGIVRMQHGTIRRHAIVGRVSRRSLTPVENRCHTWVPLVACPPVLQGGVARLAVASLALLIGSCTVQPDDVSVANRNDNSSPINDNSSSPDASAPKRLWFGLEYAVTGLGDIYAQTGAITAKPMPALMEWGRLQPNEGDAIQWSQSDDLIAEYQQAGFENMQLLTDAKSPWA